jgi:hypothetical protein
MKVEIITMWYNEEFLAPYFLRHYSWADKISLLYDLDSTDNSLALAEACPNVHIIPFRFPDMMDDEIKMNLINKQYSGTECDYVLSVDADEFAFYKHGEEFRYDLRPILETHDNCDLFRIALYTIYRHSEDSDLDPSLPAIPQRRHGVQNILADITYIKPILVRAGLHVTWGVGCHNIFFAKQHEPDIFPHFLLGAHWVMADPAFAVERRIKNRRERQSKNNLTKGMTIQHHHVTVASLISAFARHANDPLLF